MRVSLGSLLIFLAACGTTDDTKGSDLPTDDTEPDTDIRPEDDDTDPPEDSDTDAADDSDSGGDTASPTRTCAQVPTPIVYLPLDNSLTEVIGGLETIASDNQIAAWTSGTVGQGLASNVTHGGASLVPPDSFWGFGDRSVDLWFKADTPALQATQALVSFYECAGTCNTGGAPRDSTAYFQLDLDSEGRPRFSVRGIGTNANIQSVLGTHPLTDGAWHHLAAVAQPGEDTLSLYVDGVPEKTVSIVGTGMDGLFPDGDPQEDTLNLGFRGFGEDISMGFNGTLDEVAVYDQTLSPADAAALFAAGPDGRCLDGDQDGDSLGADCDDQDPSINTSASDLAGDGIDSDCDGSDGPCVALTPDLYSADGNPLTSLDPASGEALDILGDAGRHVTMYGPGKIGLGFDLGPFATPPHFNSDTEFYGAGSRTVELWAKTTDGSESALFNHDACAGANCMDANSAFSLRMLSNGALELHVGTLGGILHFGMQGSTPINDGVWHHVAAIADTSTDQLLLYVDGVEDAMAQLESGQFGVYGPDAGFEANPITLGYAVVVDGAKASYWTGQLDELGVYSTALSPSEVAALATGASRCPVVK